MDFKEIENLVELAKGNDEKAKEELMVKFTPLILNLSKKTFVNSYEFADIKNECYGTLFKCVQYYNLDKHRFVAYATTAIKNCVSLLIRVSVKRNGLEGPGSYILDGKLEHTLLSDLENPNDFLLSSFYKTKLKAALRALSLEDKELLNYIYFKGHSVKYYSTLKGLNYGAAVNKINRILGKLREALSCTKRR